MRAKLLTAVAMLALVSCSQPPAPTGSATPAQATATAAAAAMTAPSGDYMLDKAHASLIFSVDHIGYSHFTGRFLKWDAQLHLDTQNPTASTVNVTIDPTSLDHENPPTGFLNDLRNGSNWLDAAHFPQMTFHSTSVEKTGDRTARVTGDLTLRGVTKPVTLDVTLNGGYPGMSLDPHARVGLSAHGTLKRSDFGLSYGLPPPGSNMGVGDDVEILIESEFTGPAWRGDAAPAPQQH